MPLAPAPSSTSPMPAGSWTLPGEARFAEPDGYRALLSDLQRYTREEISGRSYLIAGHRGTGKTTMVLQAIDHLSRKAIIDSLDRPEMLLGQRGRPQRPLLVKIVGKSLISPPPDATEAELDTTAGQPDSDGSRKAAWALVHITIALYRALAGEIVMAATQHARSAAGDVARHREEIIAQLALALDSEPDSAELRNFWQLLGRLDDGLLWPIEAFRRKEGMIPRALERIMRGQAFREIVAVATAAQAFQICAGRLTYERKDEQGASKETKLAISADLADLLRRMGSLFAAAATGAAAFAASGNWAASLGGGAVVWLLGNLKVGVSENRSRSRAQSLSLSFLRDRGIQTLDRELPLVIDRIRDAGLAPVFVIDELDKLKDPPATMSDIIDRLKHLLADHGFFCFLTDRNYYDHLCRRVADEPYPSEHTYYSRRLLVSHRPTQMVEHLKSLIAGSEAEELPRRVFALAVAYRSKLNFADVGRALDYFIGLDQELKPQLKISADDLRSRRDLRLAATIQISIERVLHTKPFRDWFQNDPDPALVQVATDALYIIPRAWEKGPQGGSWTVDIGKGALEAQLAVRRNGTATEQPDLNMIASMVKLQAHYLSDFATLRTELTSAGSDPHYSGIVFERNAVPASGLIQEVANEVYRFILDENGFPPAERDAIISPGDRADIIALADLVQRFAALSDFAGVQVRDLAQICLLPATIRQDVKLSDVAQALREIEGTTVRHERLALAESDGKSIRTALESNGPWLAVVFGLLERLGRDVAASGKPSPIPDLLGAIHHYQNGWETGMPPSAELQAEAGIGPFEDNLKDPARIDALRQRLTERRAAASVTP